jgi:hypothetical protein
LWQHFHFPLEIAMNFQRAKGVKAKWKVLFGRPDDLDPRCRSVLERKFLNVQSDRKPNLAMRQYVTAQTLFSIVLLFVVALFEHYLSVWQLFLLSSFIIISLVNSGAILDQRRWIFYLEYTRVLLVLTAIGVFYPNNWAFSAIMGVLFLMTWYFRPMQRYYFFLLYTNSRA